VTDPTVSERIERSPVAQILISIAIVLVLLAEVAAHLPTGSAVHRLVGDESDALVRAIATEQAWGVFAPDPRGTSLRIEARVTFEDGSTARWELPEGPRIGANFRYYRWRKWLERVRSDDFEGLWAPTARWIADEYADRESPVARVELVRFFHDNVLVGEQPPYQEFTYCTYVPAQGDGCQ
jgi:hypothetical protein